MKTSALQLENESRRYRLAVLSATVWLSQLRSLLDELRRLGVKQTRSWRSQVALGCGLLLFPHSLLALDPGKSVFQFRCQNWTRQNGLPADKINTVTQAKDGYIWLGTQNGLVRFDGLEFKVIPIDLPGAQGQDVRKLMTSRDGEIRFAINNGGFGSYDGQKFSAIGDERWSKPVKNANTILEARDGAIWTGADLGLGRWVKGKPGKSFFDETTIGFVLSLCEDPAGRIWLGTAERGLYYWADGKFVEIPDALLRKRSIFAVAADSEGQIWAGTEFGLRCYFQGRLKVIPPMDNEVRALLVDSHGILWVGTVGMGLARYENGEFTYLRKSDGLGSDYVSSLFEDSEGSLWIGTRDGLSQLTDLKFPIYSSKEGIGEGSSHSVFASGKGGLWITTGAGVSYFDGKTATNYGQLPLLSNRYIKLGFEARNGDVYLVDGDKNIDFLSGNLLSAVYTNQNWPTAFAEDSESVLVTVGNGTPLFRVEAGKLRLYEYKDEERPDFFWVNNLCVAKDGSIWVASNNGIFRVKDGHFKQWTTLDGLSDDRIQWIGQDVDGSIWAGSAKGITRIKDGKVRNIRQENGLHEERIYAIIPDDHGAFWFASGRGIFRASRQSLNDFADGKTTRIQCEVFDGMESVKFTDRTDQENSGCKTLDGRIWFPSPWGVVMIDPAHIPINQVAPPVQIDRVLANGREVARSDRIIVPPGKGELEFHFAALSFIAPQKMQARYQLEGYDKDWVEAGNRRMAVYTNLKPGDYTFRVIAGNADGVWNKTGNVLKIELLPHFYQTVWFYALCGGLICVVLAGIYVWRVRHLKRTQQTLQAEVQNRTAELAKTNTSLQHEIEMHKETEDQLKQQTRSLKTEIEERKRMELEVEQVHKQLLETSRQAGMAEIATNVLHNVGNVLNSVNVSASMVIDKVKRSEVSGLAKVAALLQEHAHDLGTFVAHDAKGKHLPVYLAQLSEHLLADQTTTVKELDSLRKNIEHIKEIVAMQQNFSKVSGVTETVPVVNLVEDALNMNANSFNRHNIQVVKEFTDVPLVTVEAHKLVQILVNLMRNAKHACDDSGRADKKMTVRVANGGGRIKISVIDNGVGIPPENLTLIFNHGFTTKKDGHGFGLHSGALAAKDLGGSLTVHSDGIGHGATFILELPCQTKENSHE